MFVNLSNHPSNGWPVSQIAEAQSYGIITDIPFPIVSPDMTITEICRLAEELTEQISALNPNCVMVNGEFTLTYQVVKRLIARKMKVVSACTQRICNEHQTPTGEIKKEVTFRFEQFREYE